MAREFELIDEIRQFERPKYEITQSTHADVIVDTLVEFLRQAFSNHPIYTYIPRTDSFGPDWENTKIVIVDKYSEDALFLPVITTNVDNIQTKWLQFSQSPFNTVLKPQMNSNGTIKRDDRGVAVPSHFEYTGAYMGTVSLIINAQDTLEREELVNLLHVIMAESGRDTLYMRGIFINNVTVSGSTEFEYRNDYVYQQTVSLDIYSEWKRKIPVGETLASIGYDMGVIDQVDDGGHSTPTATATPVPVYNLEVTPYVIDNAGPNASGQPVLVDFKLDAQQNAAPIALNFNAGVGQWQISPFWKKLLEDTLIPWENLEMDILKANPVDIYLQHAAKALMQAASARALSLTQGRRLADGTKVINNDTFVFENDRVELRAFNTLDPVIYSALVMGDNEDLDARDTVIFRLAKYNKNKAILVIKNITLDSEGNVVSGDIFRRTSDGDIPVVSTLDSPRALDGVDYDTMTATDLFMILQFGQQPYKFTLSNIIDEIDKVIHQLGNMLISISNRAAKLSSLTNIKQDLLGRSERFLLRRPLGL